MQRLLIGLVSVVFAVPTVVRAQSIPDDSLVRAIITERVDAGRYAGVVVGFVTRDGRRQVTAYGPNAGVTPFDGTTVFEIGSVTKTFTAAILASMVQDGSVALDDPVARHLPDDAVIPERDGRRITLLDLATQTSGLPRLPSNFRATSPANPYADYTAREMYEFLRSYALPRDIGTQYDYSNLGFGLLGEALAHRAGKAFEALVTERILAPLGMRDSRVTLSADLMARLAPGHTAAGQVTANWDFRTFAGTGAIRSTVNDMLLYLRASADSLSQPLGRVLAQSHIARRPGPNPRTAMGLAWHRTRVPSGETIVWHNGGTGGYRSFAGFDAASGLAVIVLTNTATSVDEIGIHLLAPSVPLPRVAGRPNGTTGSR